MARTKKQLYPDFGCFIDEIDKNGITVELLQKIIQRHRGNHLYNKRLYEQYMAIEGSTAISRRKTRYNRDNAINNKIHCAFMNEIVDFKTGYFVGKPIAYGYAKGEEAEEVTGGTEAVDAAIKEVTDFTTRNNMFGVDMETVKLASIYGYSGRLFYIDTEGDIRVMPVHGYETIILSNTKITEPQYAIRYYYSYDINDNKQYTVEFYDDTNIHTYTGGSLTNLEEKEVRPHMFAYCPLQGIMNNAELMGDTEIVQDLIDDYDKVLSDNSNELESFVHAMLLVSILGESKAVKEAIQEANNSGTLHITPTGTTQVSEPVKWLTKQINDAFTEHHLERIEKQIYKKSNTPNMDDSTFGTASGEALKFKLHGLETKCGMTQSQMMNAAMYMWKLLADVWFKKSRTVVDPLQVTMKFKRNFPLNQLSQAQAAQAMIAAKVPKRAAWEESFADVDDFDYWEELENAETDVTDMYKDIDTPTEETDLVDESLDKELDEAETGGKN